MFANILNRKKARDNDLPVLGEFLKGCFFFVQIVRFDRSVIV